MSVTLTEAAATALGHLQIAAVTLQKLEQQSPFLSDEVNRQIRQSHIGIALALDAFTGSLLGELAAQGEITLWEEAEF